MNDTIRETSLQPKPSSFREKWGAFLHTTSRRLQGQSPSDPPPLWVAPGKVSRGVCDTFPHGEVIEGVLSRYAEILDTPMSFRIAGSRYSPPGPGGAVHVHAFALPTLPVLLGLWSRVSLVPLPVVYGMPLLEGASRALEPGTQFGRGVALRDEDGRVVAEYIGTNLYCLFDLLGQEEDWIPILLRRHLDLGLPHVILPRPTGRGTLARDIPARELEHRLLLLRRETETMAQGCRLARRAAAREVYIGACRGRVVEEIRFLEAEIAILEEGVEEMARRIVTDTRRFRAGHRRLNGLQGWLDPQDALRQELRRTMELPDISEADQQNGRIRLTTVPLLADLEGRRHYLGRFQIDLFLNGDVRITNLTNRVGAFDHPHVYAGRPCLGGIREGIAKLLGEFQIVAAAEVMIDFLRTVNPAEWRLSVLHWPEAEYGILAAT